MRRILSLALAVLMVVSSVTLGAVSVSAVSVGGTSSLIGSVGAGSNVTINGISGVGANIGSLGASTPGAIFGTSIGASGNLGASLGALGNLGASGILGATGDLGASIDSTGSAATGSTSAGATEVTYESLEVPADAKEITTADEFAFMDPTGIYVLANDITITESYGTFSGVLYGNGKTVTTSVPLFKKLDGATVTDLTIAGEVKSAEGAVGALAKNGSAVYLRNVTNNAPVTGLNPVGAFIGTLTDTSTFEGCVNNAPITLTNAGDVGGMIGNLNDGVDSVILTFKDCVNNGVLTGPTNTNVNAAGMVAWFAPNGAANKTLIIENCINTGDITATRRAGGFAGTCYAATLIVDRCTNTGNMTSTQGDGEARAGGIVAWAANSASSVTWLITNCRNDGKISAAGGYAGGVSGRLDPANNSVIIDNCQNNAEITGGTTGGILGVLGKCADAKIANCENNADITGTGNAAGILANLDSMNGPKVELANCVNAGVIDSGNYGGGMIGGSWCGDVTLDNCLNEKNVTGAKAAGGMIAHQRGIFTYSADKNSGTATGDLVVKNCENRGVIAGASGPKGGMIGRIYDQNSALFMNCKNTADATVNPDKKGADCAGVLGHVACDKKKPDGTTNVYPSNMTVAFENCLNEADVNGGRPGGIFGGMDGTIKGFTFKNCMNTGAIASQSNYAGGIASRPDGVSTFENCTNKGTVYGYNQYAGGIVGYGGSGAKTFTNCVNDAAVTLNDGAASKFEVGGMIGRLNGGGSYTNCLNTENGVITGPGNASGMVGRHNGVATFTNCENRGAINCTTTDGKASGISSRNDSNLTVINCVNSGKISGKSETGGIVGYNAGANAVNTFTNCLNAGEVVTTKNSTGGIAGYVKGTAIFTNCQNTQSVTGVTSYTGGIVGLAGGGVDEVKILNCKNTGKISSTGITGGIAGRLDSTSGAAADILVQNCLNEGEISVDSHGNNMDSAGIVGVVEAMSYSASIINCINKGAVTVKGKTRSGGIAGIAYGNYVTIENCLNEGTITQTDTSTSTSNWKTANYAAGIVARADANTALVIRNCTNAGTFSTNKYGGGILGLTGGTRTPDEGKQRTVLLENCKNTGAISAGWNSGAIIGYLGENSTGPIQVATIENCSNSGSVTIKSTERGGGIVGVIRESGGTINILNCSNSGDISGTKAKSDALAVNGIGGIVGVSIRCTALNITNCENTADAVITSNEAAGGILGATESDNATGVFTAAVTISNCVNNGKVVGTAGYAAGGIMGLARGYGLDVTVENCSNAGVVDGAGAHEAGGILGRSDFCDSITIENCHNTASVTGKEWVGGIMGAVQNNGADLEKNNKGELVLESVGTNSVSIKNCKNEAAVNGNYVGGIYGVSYYSSSVTVENCENTGAVTGRNSAAGIMAFHNGSKSTISVKNCVNLGTVSGNDWISGIFTRIESGDITITNCVNGSSTDATKGNLVHVEDNDDASSHIAGISAAIGADVASIVVTNCTNYANLNQPTCGNIGGILSYSNANYTEISSCLNEGNIVAEAGFATGMITNANGNADEVLVSNCVNNGTMKGKLASGAVGKMYAKKITVQYCENKATVEAIAWTAAGIMAENYGVNNTVLIDSCVNNGEIKGTASSGGIFGSCNKDGSAASGAENFTISNCVNNNTVSGKNAGGMVGNISVFTGKFLLENCANNGAVTGTGNVGGMVGNGGGSGDLEIINCSNTKKIQASGYVGGFVGGNWITGDLIVKNSLNSGEVVSTGNAAGGFVGHTRSGIRNWNDGETAYTSESEILFQNCKNTGTVNATTHMGGILGRFYEYEKVSFINCENGGVINTNGVNDYVGGILGCVNKDKSSKNMYPTNLVVSFSNCKNTNAVNGSNAAGMLATVNPELAQKLTFTNCENSGAITGTEKAAGIIARAHGSLELTGCVNSGAINGNSETGGLVGYNAMTNGTNTITNCKNSGTVTNTNTNSTGGIAGALRGVIRITDCENTGAINGHANGDVAGILGGTSGTTTITSLYIENCRNSGAISGGRIGGIYGATNTNMVNFTIKNSVNIGTINTSNYGGGIACKPVASQTESADTGIILFENCVNTGAVNAPEGWDYGGGIFGFTGNQYSDELIVRNCANGGEVNVGGTAGGILSQVNHVAKVTIENCSNNAAVTSKNTHAAGMAAIIQGGVSTASITNCVNNAAISGAEHVAGIVALCRAATSLTVDACENNGTVTGNAKTNYLSAGGIVGVTCETGAVTITNSVNTAEVKGARFNAGIYARVTPNKGTDIHKDEASGNDDANDALKTLTITNCVNNGIINKDYNSPNDCGGIVATTDKCATVTIKITDCANTAAVYGYRPGGIIGVSVSPLTLDGCVNTGAITSNGNYAGGIASRADGIFTATDCVNTGDVESGNQYAAGILSLHSREHYKGTGTFVATFKNCVNTGNIVGKNQGTGGIAGQCVGRALAYNCVNTGDVTSDRSSAGIISRMGTGSVSGHVISGCISTGNITNTGEEIAATDTDMALSAAGIATYAWGDLKVSNCTVGGTITSGENAKSAAAFICYSNNAGSSVKNSVMLPTTVLTSAYGQTHVVNWYNTDAQTPTNPASTNSGVYIPDGTTYNIYRAGATTGNVAIPADYAYFYAAADVASGALTTAVNTTAGEGTFVQSDDALPVYKETVALYNAAAKDPVLPTVLKAATGADTTKLPATDATIYEAPDVTIGSYTDDTTKLGYVAPEAEELGTVGVDAALGTPGVESTVSAPGLDAELGTPGVESGLTAPGLDAELGTPGNSGTNGVDSETAGADTSLITGPDSSDLGLYDTNTVIEIGTAAEFLAMKPGGSYKLTAPIILTTSYEGVFYGMLDGNGQTVTVQGAPVFESLVGATVENLTVTGEVNDTASDYVGAVANTTNTVLLSGITNNASVSGKNAGGLVGYTNGLFEVVDSVNKGSVNGTTAGGIVGAVDEMATITFDNCSNEGTITATEVAGGIAAVTNGATYVKGAVNNGDVTSTAGYAGGIVGRAGIEGSVSSLKLHVFENCVNTGDVTSHREYAGGILAYTGDSAAFISCRNDGNVSGDAYCMAATKGTTCANAGCGHNTEDTLYLYAGGIAGAVQYEGTFYSCVNTGDVSANSRVGGIVGSVGEGNMSGIVGYNEFIGCVTTGDILHNGQYSDTATKAAGGLFGYANSPSAYKALVVAYCGVAGSVTLEVTDDTSAEVVGAIGGYANNAASYYEYNYVTAEISANGGTASVLPYAPTVDVPATNVVSNYTANDDIYYVIDKGGVESIPADLVITVTEVEDGTLTTDFNELLGFDAFVQDEELGVPVFDSENLSEVITTPEAITSAEEFASMDPYGNYYLANDITITESYKYIFSGVFDGKGYTVTTTAPLFTELEGAAVLNLNIEGSVKENGVSVGALANAADSVNLYNILNKAEVVNTANNTAKETTRYVVGGLVGDLTGTSTVTNCKNSGKVAGSAPGGIAGRAVGNIAIFGAINNAMITNYSNATTAGGGLIAYAQDGNYVLKDCINTGMISFTTSTKHTTRAGGMIGFICAKEATLEMTGCVNSGNVIGGDQVGGLVGWAQAVCTFIECTNFGNVISSNNYAGGIVARADYNTYYSEDKNGDGAKEDYFNDDKITQTFTNCTNMGNVYSHRQYAGGMVGYSQVNVKANYCLNTGYVGTEDPYNGNKCEDNGCHTGTNTRSVQAGGMAGSVRGNGQFEYCVNTGDVKSPVRAAGIAAYLGSNGFANHYAKGCVVTGDILNTGVLVSATSTDMALGAAGICAYAYGAFDTTYCTVAGNVTAEGNANSVAAFVCYSNNGGTDIKHNAMIGTMSCDEGYYQIENWYNTNTRPSGNTANYVVEGTEAVLYRDKNDDKFMISEDYKFFFAEGDVASGALTATLNGGAGEGTFVQNDGIPMHKDAVDVYGRADDTVGSYIPEEALPVVPETSAPETGDTTAPEDTTEDTESDTVEGGGTTEPGDSDTNAPADSTTEEPGNTTEPEGDDTTTEPDGTETTPTGGDKGCGSVIGASAMIMALALIAPAALVIKKRED